MTLGLGRLYAPDRRDHGFLMAAVLPVATVTHRAWYQNGWWGDQGATPQCVGYAWAHWLEDGPVTQGGSAPILAPSVIYHEAQLVDEWPGEAYDGTSGRAGAKVLQARRFIDSYLWAFDAETVVNAILSTGPVVVGTNWYEGMFAANAAGKLTISGVIAGGHEYVLNGASRASGLVRIKNSWGRAWGRNGNAWLSFADLDRLLKEDGEACLAVEQHG